MLAIKHRGVNINISRSEVDRIAALARLWFSEDETERLASEMTQILEYMSVLDEIDIVGFPIPPPDTDARNADERNRLRHDIARPVDGRSLLEQAASRDGDHLSVPNVFRKRKP